MINENYGNALFGFVGVATLLASIKHSEYISDNVSLSEQYYVGASMGVVITCLFANICLGIFSLFILGNLSDYIQRMTVNLIGARQKLRVLAILVLLSFFFYTSANVICFIRCMRLVGIERKMAFNSLTVSVLQLVHIFSIHLIHPDVFGFKLRSDLNEFDQCKKSKVYYI